MLKLIVMKKNKIPVTMRALIQRVNRKIAHDGQKLQSTHKRKPLLEEGTLDSEIQVIESVAQSINNERAAKTVLLNAAIAALKVALAQYESELARIEKKNFN